VPLSTGNDLVVVAHQDDDLLFMQPDVFELVQRGTGVTTVYITAGNGTKGAEVSARRDVGLMEAYGALVGDKSWTCGYIELLGHLAQHCRLASANLSLVFLAYPDGGKQGEQADSLLHLWEGSIDRATTVADRTTTYTREQLVEVIAEVMRETQPKLVHTLEIASTHGHDHADHMVVGAVTLVAIARAPSTADLISYRGYNTAGEPVNKPPAIIAFEHEIVGRYEACVDSCGVCGESCTSFDGAHEIWLQRRYAVGFRPSAAGAIVSGSQCLDVTGSGVTLGDCSAPTQWSFHDGALESAAGCLEVLPTGDLAVGACIGGPARRFFVDDEAHVWSAMLPDPQPGLDFAHLRCLTPASSLASAALCGLGAAPTWVIAPPLVSTPRATIGIAATGRAVRLGDLTGDGLADLCAVDATGLLCAPGDGKGGFGAAIRVDSAASPLVIEPMSLTLGDVDGDHRVDACGRDGHGVMCALSSQAFAVTRFTPRFDASDARMCTSSSLAAIDANGDGVAEICGFAAEGVICTPQGLSFSPMVRSVWPDPTALVWPADLDGDHRADWCSTSSAGPACGLDAESALTSDGVPWGYSFQGTVEDVPADPARTAAADIDGDGNSDLCVLEPGKITCARSQGHGFGPRAPFAIVPDGATALWLGDLDGDGRADACVDAGATIACVLAR
jgi:LmbE family N-acetylglucosaminyl deacetylase